ncbi:hypothetical protein C9J21_18540 [Photobacterium phosphoreum]|uniref:hypothetical protein n=1 Tax=Photobacterium phosphoreum TaxID=659 RepID=UPI000D16502A|nr:hypothetical protein [Photobacterium phosphoreum]PSW30804.1 hypothetical protein C9J21_18540 [Photobacterium phosphoreum]
MTGKASLKTITIGNNIISVNSLALLIEYSSTTSRPSDLLNAFVNSISHQYKVNIPATIIFNEPVNYDLFIKNLQLEHSQELLAAYEFCYVELKKQTALLSLIKKITDMLWRGELKKENLCGYLHKTVQSV